MQAIWTEYKAVTSGGNSMQYRRDVALAAFQGLCELGLVVPLDRGGAGSKVAARERVAHCLTLSADELRYTLHCSPRSTPAMRDALQAPLRSQQAGTCAW